MYLDPVVLFVIGVVRIGHAPLIHSETLTRLQHPVNFFIASNLKRLNVLITNKQSIYKSKLNTVKIYTLDLVHGR